jgi:2,3,4,5-tetrahydropyridine-2-carboxylate N-succinyltransferase
VNSFAFGLGVGTQNASGEWLEVYYPQPRLLPGTPLCNALGEHFGTRSMDSADLRTLARTCRDAGDTATAALAERLSQSARPCVATLLADDSPPDSVPAAYLKLHLISHRLLRPHSCDLQGLFAVLPNVAWTSAGPIDPLELPERQLDARLRGETLCVDSVDKFPRMTDYVVPAGVRIADSARVRLGAYVGTGTTVMHEGFINFNAGTEGPGMIEGRISAGVVVGAHSDLGGGCSTMGTLSGGGDIVISVGEYCLIGANAGIGIPLGDRCTVESGLYVTAGSKVTVLDADGHPRDTVSARQLAGLSDLLFRRNSLHGAIECLSNRSAIELNQELHANN